MMIRSTLAILFALGVAGCFEISKTAESNAADSKESLQLIHEAIDTLERVQAATQVGVNQITYSQMLIDAQLKANRAVSTVTVPEVQMHIARAMDAYSDAGKVWSYARNGSLNYEIGPTKHYMEKYTIPIEKGETYPYNPGHITSRYVVGTIWDRASDSLKRAKQALSSLDAP